MRLLPAFHGLSSSDRSDSLIDSNLKMDDATAATVLKLQLEDINDLLEHKEYNANGQDFSDGQYALKLYRKDLEARDALLRDRRMACSIITAVCSDSDIIAMTQQDEYHCAYDHREALRVSGHAQLGTHSSAPLAPPIQESISEALTNINRVSPLAPDFVFPVPHSVYESKHTVIHQDLKATSGEVLKDINNDVTPEQGHIKRKRSPSAIPRIDPGQQATLPDQASSLEQLESGLPAAKRLKVLSPEPEAEHSTKVEPVKICIACRETSLELVRVHCGHLYCMVCLAAYVEASLTPTDSEFPPVCCKLPITPDIIKNSVLPDLFKRYTERKGQEFARCALYCAEQGCAVAIEQANIADNKGHCVACNRDTCKLCRLAWHGIEKCPTNEEREKTMALSKSEGWQSCYKCSNMVELNMGCYHIR